MDTDRSFQHQNTPRILRVVADMVLGNPEAMSEKQEEVTRLLGGVAGVTTTFELFDITSPSEHEIVMAKRIDSAVESLTNVTPWKRERVVNRFQSKGAKTIADILTLGKHRTRGMNNFGPRSLQHTEDMLRILGVAELWKEHPSIDDVVTYCSTLDKVPYLAIGSSDFSLLSHMSIEAISNLSPEELASKAHIGRMQASEPWGERIFVPNMAVAEQIHTKARQFAERFELAVARRS